MKMLVTVLAAAAATSFCSGTTTVLDPGPGTQYLGVWCGGQTVDEFADGFVTPAESTQVQAQIDADTAELAAIFARGGLTDAERARMAALEAELTSLYGQLAADTAELESLDASGGDPARIAFLEAEVERLQAQINADGAELGDLQARDLLTYEDQQRIQALKAEIAADQARLWGIAKAVVRVTTRCNGSGRGSPNRNYMACWRVTFDPGGAPVARDSLSSGTWLQGSTAVPCTEVLADGSTAVLALDPSAVFQKKDAQGMVLANLGTVATAAGHRAELATP